MADYYKLENDVKKLKEVVKALSESFDLFMDLNLPDRMEKLEDFNLDERVGKLEKSEKFASFEKLKERHSVLDDVFDKMEQDGVMPDLVGKTSDEMSTLVLLYAKLNGIDIGEGSETGIKHSITRRLQVRYGVDLNNSNKKFQAIS